MAHVIGGSLPGKIWAASEQNSQNLLGEDDPLGLLGHRRTGMDNGFGGDIFVIVLVEYNVVFSPAAVLFLLNPYFYV